MDCNILSGPQGRCTCQKHVTITPLQGEFRRLMYEHEQLQKDYKLVVYQRDTYKEMTASDGKRLAELKAALKRERRYGTWYAPMVGAVGGVVGWNIVAPWLFDLLGWF